jgi:SAM domain (Sterile alpha motif)
MTGGNEPEPADHAQLIVVSKAQWTPTGWHVRSQGVLGEIGLGQYSDALLENDIDLEIISELTEADLEKLGLSLGHRKKLLRAVASVRASSAVDVPADKPLDVGTLPSVAARPPTASLDYHLLRSRRLDCSCFQD